MSLILSIEQAESIYSAMCVLNNVNGKVKVEFGSVAYEGINVFESNTGQVRVALVKEYRMVAHEDYDSQNEFAIAYERK